MIKKTTSRKEINITDVNFFRRFSIPHKVINLQKTIPGAMSPWEMSMLM